MNKSSLIDKYILDNRSWVITRHRSLGDEPGDDEILIRHNPVGENFTALYEDGSLYNSEQFLKSGSNGVLLQTLVRDASPLLTPKESTLLNAYRNLGLAINKGMEDQLRNLIVDIGL